MKTCKVENCKNKYFEKGYCRSHYRSLYWYPKNKEKHRQYQKEYRLKHYGMGNRKHKCEIENCNNMVYLKSKYCGRHKRRMLHIPWELFMEKKRKEWQGKNNPRWHGGVAEYPNHCLMKKNRLIILINNPICKICNKKPAVEVHHKNGDKSDHRLSNMVASCHSCNSSIRFKPNNSKYRRIYGMNLEEMANKFDCASETIWKWHQQNKLKDLLKSLDFSQIV